MAICKIIEGANVPKFKVGKPSTRSQAEYPKKRRVNEPSNHTLNNCSSFWYYSGMLPIK